jgi:hypothetical protein
VCPYVDRKIDYKQHFIALKKNNVWLRCEKFCKVPVQKNNLAPYVMVDW